MIVKKELYMDYPKPGHAVNISNNYLATTGLDRVERRSFECEGRDDLPLEPQIRYSKDNGKTWDAWRKQPEVVLFHDDYIIVGAQPSEKEPPPWSSVIEDATTGYWLSIELRQTICLKQNRRYRNHCFWRFSKDRGISWSKLKLLQYEKGSDFDPENPLKNDFLERNSCFPGGVINRSDGSIVFCGTSINIPENAPDTDPEGLYGNWWSPSHARDIGCALFKAKFDMEKGTYIWEFGNCIWMPMSVSCRGFDEGFPIELKDGRVLVVCRGSNTNVTPGRKWYSITDTDNIILQSPSDFRYDDGSTFYSPASIHGFLRHSENKKLYWVANITKEPPSGNSPRYPLIIAEIDESKPAVIKNSVTVIADKEAEHSKDVQWSNFSLLENRETHEIELYMTPIGSKATHKENKDLFWETGCYKFTLVP